MGSRSPEREEPPTSGLLTAMPRSHWTPLKKPLDHEDEEGGLSGGRKQSSGAEGSREGTRWRSFFTGISETE